MNIHLIQILAICGMADPIIYTLKWILRSIVQSEYDHVRDDISSLFTVEVPRKRLFNSFIAVSSCYLSII